VLPGGLSLICTVESGAGSKVRQVCHIDRELAYHKHNLLGLLLKADAVAVSCIPLTVVEGTHLHRICRHMGLGAAAGLESGADGAYASMR
jgi:hypothetical protein